MQTVEIDRLREEFSYNPETGELRRNRDGSAVGVKNDSGYLRVQMMLDGKLRHVRVHRICWALHNGKWPDGIIDHVNRVRNDNRACNLRLASTHESSQNRSPNRHTKSGFKGVVYEPRRRRGKGRGWKGPRWEASITASDKGVYRRKRFRSALQAALAYDRWSRELFGEHAYTNLPKPFWTCPADIVRR